MLGENAHILLALDAAGLLKSVGVAASIVGTAAAILTTLATRTVPWIKAKRGARLVKNSLTGQLYTPEGVNRSLRYYVSPDCQDLDPAGGEEPRLVLGVRQKLFDLLDRALGSGTEYRYIILLADSGMGKTSALLNYHVRHLRRLRKPFKLAVIPLGIPDADERIAAIDEKSSTVLFLDALDEDTQAIVDHVERLRLLIRATRDFHRVLVSSRTQFFAKEEEIPTRTGILKVHSRAADEPAEYVFHKIYLSPFSDQQVDAYIRRRYQPWERRNRRLARRIVAQIPNLAVRPMLLAHVEDLVHSNVAIRTTSQLYEQMVNAWIRREEDIISGTTGLREFSERVAVDLYLKRTERGAERIPAQDLRALALQWGVTLDDWRVTGRSLLNRDVEGNYKFAHRSIMEYLFVRRFTFGLDMACLDSEWTDQMRKFFMETTSLEKPEFLPYLVAADPSRIRQFLDELRRADAQRPPARGLTIHAILSELISISLSEMKDDDVSLAVFNLAEPHYRLRELKRWGTAGWDNSIFAVYEWLANSAGGRNFDLSEASISAVDERVQQKAWIAYRLGLRSLFCRWITSSADDSSTTDGPRAQAPPTYLLVAKSNRPGAFTAQRIGLLTAEAAEWAAWAVRQ